MKSDKIADNDGVRDDAIQAVTPNGAKSDIARVILVRRRCRDCVTVIENNNDRRDHHCGGRRTRSTVGRATIDSRYRTGFCGLYTLGTLRTHATRLESSSVRSRLRFRRVISRPAGDRTRCNTSHRTPHARLYL